MISRHHRRAIEAVRSAYRIRIELLRGEVHRAHSLLAQTRLALDRSRASERAARDAFLALATFVAIGPSRALPDFAGSFEARRQQLGHRIDLMQDTCAEHQILEQLHRSQTRMAQKGWRAACEKLHVLERRSKATLRQRDSRQQELADAEACPGRGGAVVWQSLFTMKPRQA